MNGMIVQEIAKMHDKFFTWFVLVLGEMWSLQKDYFKSKYRIVSPASSKPGFVKGESQKFLL